ncbi:NuA4 histone acetyltransferase subunit [Tulasnella sp. 403]|nr:NuA4 histone acetyltransferase subunit [Tulasnella sp. 403]
MIYGGDEISALVLDIGSSSTRLGYAGEDTPRCVIPTSYGYIPRTVKTLNAEGVEVETISRDLYVGENGVGRWRPGMEVGNPMAEGLVYDFSATKDIISHAFDKGLEVNPQEHPVLVTEPAWNTAANRERMAEILFEEFQVPAFYVSNNAVLSASGIQHSTLPGLVMDSAHSILAHGDQMRPPIDLLPYQLIDKKQPVEPNAPPRCVLRDDRLQQTTTSWRNWALRREVDEWMMACCAILPKGFSEDAARAWPRKAYEFPTGFNSTFGSERFIPGDIYFTHQHLPPPAPGMFHPATLPELMTNSLRACEPDLRPALFNNVVLTGGGSLLSGMGDRLASELQKISGGQKVRLHVPGNALERRYGAWLGGSILASLGTFHQLWISKQEWQNMIFYGILGINGAVFSLWWYATESYVKFRDPQLYIWMHRNFTTGIKNLSEGRYWTLLTACFSHQDFNHIAVNLLTFWFMAKPALAMLGNTSFLALYLGGGLVSSFVSWAYSSVTRRQIASHGASGAISAITAFYATLWPTSTFLIFMVIPMPAWACVGGFALWDLYGALTNPARTVDSAGHLGGLLGGVLYALRFARRI